MKTWTPLWSTIINSTVWSESKETKILWITMLAMKDVNGFVETSMPGLARAAVLSLEECVESLNVLESPDPHSSTPDFEGRRIKKVDRGWLILNHELHKDEMAAQRERNRRAYQAVKQKEYRKREKAKKVAGRGDASYIRAMEAGAGDTLLNSMTNPQEAEITRIVEACNELVDPTDPTRIADIIKEVETQSPLYQCTKTQLLVSQYPAPILRST